MLELNGKALSNLQKMKNNLKILINELKGFIKDNLNKSEVFTIVYGSYAYGIQKNKSDLDIMVICNKINRNYIKKIKGFVISLHKRHNLKIDNEIPYENKLLVSKKIFERGLSGDGFEYKNRRFYIPPIKKTKKFLSSKKIVMRLALNAMTSKNIFINGDHKYYKKMKERAIISLIKIVSSARGKIEINPKKFVELIIGDKDKIGEMYLGYKNNNIIKNYLRKEFNRYLKLYPQI